MNTTTTQQIKSILEAANGICTVDIIKKDGSKRSFSTSNEFVLPTSGNGRQKPEDLHTIIEQDADGELHWKSFRSHQVKAITVGGKVHSFSHS